MIDNQLMISEEKELTTAGASSDTFDIGLAGYGPGTPIRLKCIINTAFTSDGAATLAIAVYSGATDGSTTLTLYSLGATAKASLTKGATLIDMVLPANTMRWLKVTYTVGVADMTAGALSTYLDVA